LADGVAGAGCAGRKPGSGKYGTTPLAPAPWSTITLVLPRRISSMVSR
jgi:hypothetical protein